MGNSIKRGIIVSCQPYNGKEPFYDYEFIKRFAMSAEFGGAVAVRIECSSNIRRLIANGISIPIIGLIKKFNPEQNIDRISITPTIREVTELYKSGAHIIATDITIREGRNKNYYRYFLKEIENTYKDVDIFADVSTIDEAIIAQDLGVSYISSTLTGYTEETKNQTVPNFDILSMFEKYISIPYIAEGGYSRFEDVRTALSYGVHGVAVGTAITRPHILTEKYSKVFEEYSDECAKRSL